MMFESQSKFYTVDCNVKLEPLTELVVFKKSFNDLRFASGFLFALVVFSVANKSTY